MVGANFTYIANILIFIFYMIFCKDKPAWPVQFVYWPWILYIIHMCFHYSFDGMQNTSRNIARIYLMNRYGLQYDKSMIYKIQELLIPNSLLPVIILWQLLHIGSFFSILIHQGWGTVLLAEVGIFIIPTFIPINYQPHLKRLLKYSQSLSINSSSEFFAFGISPVELHRLFDHAISEQINPQKWWGEEYRAKIEYEQEQFDKDKNST